MPELPSSENLFSTLTYVLFVAPAAVVVIWVVWRVMVWCLFYTALVSAWVGRLPAVFQIPIVIGLLLIAWPLLLLALLGWILTVIFPRLALEQGEVPRLFARSTSPALSYIFLSLLLLPLVLVPLRYLADRLEGPQISFWHWVLVFGPLPILAIWLVARVRRNQIGDRPVSYFDTRAPVGVWRTRYSAAMRLAAPARRMGDFSAGAHVEQAIAASARPAALMRATIGPST